MGTRTTINRSSGYTSFDGPRKRHLHAATGDVSEKNNEDLNHQSSPENDSGGNGVITPQDLEYMQLAVDHAQRGWGWTFPNPAVGCVLVRNTSDNGQLSSESDAESVIVGQGFHPRAGYPHAEIFALLEAAGHVKSGVETAQAVIQSHQMKMKRLLAFSSKKPSRKVPQQPSSGGSKLQYEELAIRAQEFLDTYANDPQGPDRLFANACHHQDPPAGSSSSSTDEPAAGMVTAYVTLEPCCHYGRTPPCAASLALARVQRVVVGYRDPNPRVDGGGVQLLRGTGVQVDVLSEQDGTNATNTHADYDTTAAAASADAVFQMEQSCQALVENFVPRILPKTERYQYDTYMTGNHRMALRSLSNKMKAAGTLPISNWTGPPLSQLVTEFFHNNDDSQSSDPTVIEEDNENDNQEDATDDVFTMESLQHCLTQVPDWMERLDQLLWQHELVGLRLNQAVGKKRVTKLLGRCIADTLQAHVAQCQGHTVLLYRPAFPHPILDLEELVDDYKNRRKNKKNNKSTSEM